MKCLAATFAILTPTFLVGVVGQVVGSCVIMIEDIHTMDLCSWKLLQAVQESCPAVWIAVSLRPMLVEDSPAEVVMLKSLMKSKSAKHVMIAPFTKEGTMSVLFCVVSHISRDHQQVMTTTLNSSSMLQSSPVNGSSLESDIR